MLITRLVFWNGIERHSAKFSVLLHRAIFVKSGFFMVGHDCVLSSAVFALSSYRWKSFYSTVFPWWTDSIGNYCIPSRNANEERAIGYFLLSYPRIFVKNQVALLDAGCTVEVDTVGIINSIPFRNQSLPSKSWNVTNSRKRHIILPPNNTNINFESQLSCNLYSLRLSICFV